MKKYFLLTLVILLTSCSSSDDSTDDNNENDNSNFSITLSTNTSAVVDEVIPIDISGNETIMTLQASLDNFQTTVFNQTQSNGFGASTTLYFSFDKLGSKNISIKAINGDGDESVQTATVTISRGNAVKITTVQVLSFSNIDGTWDTEFPNTDPNHLADVFFHLRKPQTSTTSGSLGFQDWFTSTIKENQGNLTWDISSEGLYLNPQLSLQYSMADDDGSADQDLMLGSPFEREITFAEHITNQPNTITLSVPDIDLEVVLTIEWN